MGRAASSYARDRSPSGTNSSRGTRSIASRTRWSTMSRPRSWSSTMRARAVSVESGGMSGGTHRGRGLDSEVAQHRGRDFDDRAGRVETDCEHRDLRIADLEGAVTAATRVMAAAHVRELEARRGGDDQVAGVRVLQGGPRTLERVRVREQRLVAVRREAAVRPDEAELLAGSTGDRLVTVEVEHDFGTLFSIEAPRQLVGLRATAREAIHHRRAVRSRHRQVSGAAAGAEEREAVERGLQSHTP